jgi:putative restriction endonuclease
LAEKGLLTSNKLSITPEIVLSFKEYFNTLVKTGHHENFALPFFHLKNEPFYRLIPKLGFEKQLEKMKSVKSLHKLIKLVAFAEIDNKLFQLLQIQSYRLIIKKFLIELYFPKELLYLHNEIQGYLENSIENDILNDSRADYNIKLNSIKARLDESNFEEELFVRGGVFKKTVPKIYDYVCCISGMKIISNHKFQMIDACHIIPFSLSQDDTISNGISLNPTLHRAFDRGLITIGTDYKVKISNSIIESESTRDFIEFNGSQIKIPRSEKYLPSFEALNWHNQEIFLG